MAHPLFFTIVALLCALFNIYITIIFYLAIRHGRIKSSITNKFLMGLNAFLGTINFYIFVMDIIKIIKL